MAAPTITLKPYAYLTVDECKEWLKITKPDYDNIIARLINVATDKVQQYIEGPVLNQRYVEQQDGNSSDVLVPVQWPVRAIEEIRIDFNRKFDASTEIETDNYVLRGLPEMNNVSGDFTVNLKGTDIVLRDDNSTTILGRIFSGSVVGSIRMTYTAGWGATPDVLPSDLVHATLMLVEYLWILRENRELNIKSKTNNNQGYTRDTGIPKEITDMLDEYKDFSFGNTNRPQKNTFII